MTTDIVKRLEQLRAAIPSVAAAEKATVSCGAFDPESYQQRMERLHKAGDNAFGQEEIAKAFRRCGRR